MSYKPARPSNERPPPVFVARISSRRVAPPEHQKPFHGANLFGLTCIIGQGRVVYTGSQMRKSIHLLMLCALTAALGLAEAPQAPAPRNRVIGVVTATDQDSSTLTVKSDAGETYKVSVAAAAKLLRVAPGQTIADAQPIQFTDISVGDRVLAQGPLKDPDKTVEAVRVIDMSQADLAKKHQQEQADWQHRSVAGTATVKDEPTSTLTLRLPSMTGAGDSVKVVVSNKTTFKRYVQDSVKYADAKPSTLAEIGVGDQVRVLGNKDDAGAVQAEQIVSGAFVTLAATVVSVDAAGGFVQAKNMQNGKPLRIKITPDSNVRRMPQMAGGPPGATPGGGQGAWAGGGAQRPAGAGQGGAQASAQAGAGGAPPGAAPGGQRRGGDLSRFMDFMPKIAVDALKPGETIVVASSKGSSPDEVTALTLLAGADFLVNMAQMRAAQGQRAGAANGPSMNMNLDVMSMVPAQ